MTMSDDKTTTEEEKKPEITAENDAPKEVDDAKADSLKEVSDEKSAESAEKDSDTKEAEATEDTKTDDSEAAVGADVTDVPEEEAGEVLANENLKAGMKVRVHEIIKDTNAKGEERERVQVFEGIILGISGDGIHKTMTVRKVSGGIGVEKIYPLSSPHVKEVEVVREMRVRRSKLWFLRRGKTKRRMKEVKKS